MESYTLRVKLQVMQNKSQEHGITHPGVGSAVAGREVETRWWRIHWECETSVCHAGADAGSADAFVLTYWWWRGK